MNRRSVLQWVSALLATASASLVAIPGVGYVLGGIRKQHSSKAMIQRVARLADLTPGKPTLFSIVGSGQDAWSAQPQRVLGRVWLVRSAGDSEDEPPQVTALTAVCPHLGCTIQLDARGQRFVCPCHRAVFDFNGKKIAANESGEKNHAPRSMDVLDCRVVQNETDNASWVEVEFAEFEPGSPKKVRKA